MRTTTSTPTNAINVTSTARNTAIQPSAARTTKSNLMAAHGQWASRPADERFWSLSDLWQTIDARNKNSAEAKLTCKQLTATVKDDDVCLMGPAGVPAQLTHWAFDQLVRKVAPGAGLDYLRSLPAKMTADLMNYGLKQVRSDDAAQLLMYKDKTAPNSTALVRAITTDYSRLWNGQIVQALMKNGLQNGWMTPPARPVPGLNDPRARKATAEDIVPGQENFGLAVKEGDMIAPAGIYEGDRDMFLFLVNPSKIIDDKGGGLMRGCFIWNSEVGGGAFSVETFLLENVCGNHIVWGASDVRRVRMIHRGEKISKFANKMYQFFDAQTPDDLRAEELMIAKAKTIMLGKNKEEVVKMLYERKTLQLSKGDAEDAFDTAVRWEKTAGAVPTSVWGFVHGLTRFSQTMKYTDQREKLDEIGGKIIDWMVAV